jgi:hypothetical protein
MNLQITVIVPEGYSIELKQADPGVEVFAALIKPFPLEKPCPNSAKT